MRHRHLVLPGQKDGLRPFYDKLHALRQHTAHASGVTIMHIGGSHVQAGDITNALRMRFEPAGDRGMLFPFRAIRTNGPSSYRIEYTGMWKGSRNVSMQPDVALGLSGAAAITSDKTASLTLHLRDEGRWDFDELIVLGETSDDTVRPYLVTLSGDTIWADDILGRIADVEGTWVFKLQQPDSVVTLGITGLRRTISPKQNRRTYLPLDDSHYFVLRGMIPKSERLGVTYTDAGINGASLPSWQRCGQHFDQELSLLPPDLLIMAVGINDANVPEAEFDPEVFKENYRQLIARVRAIKPDCCLLWITNNDSAKRIGRGRRAHYVVNKNGPRVRQAMMELAEEYDGAVLDVYALMGELGSSQQWVNAKLMQRDRVHFTHEGYRLIGNILYDAIAEDYARYYF